MKFRKGNAVEVMKRKEQRESWFPGTIISADSCNCRVRYDLFLDSEGNPFVENVSIEAVRPCPPVKGGVGWVAGDTVEVFDVHCWTVGKIVKVLSNDRFVIRLSGSIQLKEFKRSDLRVRQMWRNNSWVVIDKDGGRIVDNAKLNTSKYPQQRSCISPEDGNGIPKEAGMNTGQGNLKTFTPATTLKRKHECNFKLSPEDMATRGGIKEKKTSIKAEQCHMLPAGTSPLLRQVDVISSPKKKMGKKCTIRSTMDAKTNKIHQYSMPVCANEENTECSVASCSSNGPVGYTSQHFRKSRGVSGSSFNDAESLCAPKSVRKCLPYQDKVELEADVHKLELQAYNLTMQALYASGPLSWEQESLLTNLRLSLHISNEEHLFHLRQLLSAQVLC